MKTTDDATVAAGRRLFVGSAIRIEAMNDRLRLGLTSFLMLFVELALIRWTGSNIVYLSYFSNFVLLGSFLGIGIGFLRARADLNLFPWAPVALAALVLFVLYFPVTIDRSGSQVIYFGSFQRTGLPTWVTLPVIFVVVAAVMEMVAEGVARTFALFEPLDAYRLDIMGSIAGIVVFSAMSFLRLPPVAWGIVAAAVFLVLLGRAMRPLAITALILLVVLLGAESLQPLTSWSPYYKISLQRGPHNSYDVAVNGIPHQSIESTALRRRLEPIYFVPYKRVRRDPLNNVLVVGAGNGTDVAIALKEGARHVDAVEIDPRIYQLGKELQPNHPYQDPRVSVYVDDGRAFLERTTTHYNLILFALPDSLTLVSGQSALRLESYLFTTEAMQAAKEHLTPGGVFAMYNYYRQRWLLDRYANTLRQVYSKAPCVDSVGTTGALALLTASLRTDALACPHRWVSATSPAPDPVTDNRPFPYLRTPSIPGFYLLAIALILLTSVVLIRIAGGPFRQMSSYADLFFMGCAFLLLETKNVVQFALLFGTTWFVNALVFMGILLAVFAAVTVAKRIRATRVWLLYVALFIALAVAYVIPQESLLNLSLPVRFLVAVTVAFTPIFLANLIFAERFRDVGSSTVAFGANLLGAMVGGTLEYASLILGFQALLFFVAGFYLLAFLLQPRGAKAVLA
ncbi:MAG: spermidine synthase [Actinomycetota bacterium]|nr:spermidine synthase [Actinomycetota bacterium]